MGMKLSIYRKIFITTAILSVFIPNFLAEIQLMGSQEWIDVKKYCKTLGTTPVPGVGVLTNPRPVFGHMTFNIYSVGFIDTCISLPKVKIKTQNFLDMIPWVIQVHLCHIWVSIKPKIYP